MEIQKVKRGFTPVSLHETPDLDRRFIIFALAATVVVGVLTLRLWYLQLYKGDEYHNLSIHNRIRLRHLMPMRGLILDRKGRVLVSNRPSFSVYMDMDQADVDGRGRATSRCDSRILQRRILHSPSAGEEGCIYQ